MNEAMRRLFDAYVERWGPAPEEIRDLETLMYGCISAHEIDALQLVVTAGAVRKETYEECRARVVLHGDEPYIAPRTVREKRVAWLTAVKWDEASDNELEVVLSAMARCTRWEGIPE